MGSKQATSNGPAKLNHVPLNEKTFECTHQDCNKRFTRAEHLQRHALNHLPGGSSCPICHVHFKRPDLLKRHMDRHRQRDIEAGGPGCGVLDTRKRSWAAPDGSVVEKRPRRQDQHQIATSSSDRLRPETQQVPSPESEPTENNGNRSPDRRHWAYATDKEVLGSNLPGLGHPSDFALEDPAFTPLSLRSRIQPGHRFLGAPGYPQQTGHSIPVDEPWADQVDSIPLINPPFADNNSQLDYDQIFQPDTASSFNMPYTTALDYNWLFNVGGNSVSISKGREGGVQSNLITNIPGASYTISPESMNSAQLWADRNDLHNPEPSISHSNQQQFSLASGKRPAPSTSSDMAMIMGSAPQRRGRSAVTESSRPESIETDRPFSMLQNPPPIPKIDEETRERLLRVIEGANPCLPDPRESLWVDPLLSVKSLQEYLDLYFYRFNTAYPLIHLATFDIKEVETLLLLSVLLLGATYSGKDSHQLAVCIHDVIRPSIFAHAGFSPRPELWTLQTILLVECFGKSRAGQKQHDMSHLFHGLLINLIRRSDCQSVRPAGPPSGPAEDRGTALQEAWLRWAIAEQKNRLALLCFMWDTQHAVLFCQSLCMSAFELRLELPCNQRIWEASDAVSWASSWHSTSSSAQGNFFLPALKSYLATSVSRPRSLSGLSRVLLLHGLMSIAWDMQRRDQTALGVVSGDTLGGNWRKVIGTAYEAWKADFDAHCVAVTSNLQQISSDEAQRSEYIAFTVAYNALYHSAQALLNMDFLDMQIYAGARHILGRPVQQKDYRRSAKTVKQWASAVAEEARRESSTSQPSRSHSTGPCGEQQTGFRTNSANLAAWHAGRMLHEGLKVLTGPDAMSLFHVPWCLYLATLTCWAFHHARPNRAYRTAPFDDNEEDDDDSDGSDEMVWDPQGEMKALVAGMADVGQLSSISGASQRRQTTGLVWTMAEILTKVRWGIVHAGVVVLRGLVPRRLINQYDEPPEENLGSGRRFSHG